MPSSIRLLPCLASLNALAALSACQGYTVGRLSVYEPGDGFNSGELACGGQFTEAQHHVALRRWHKLGCGRSILLFSPVTARASVAPVRDAGPFGIYQPPLRRAVPEGRWKVWTKSRPPRGWRWRGHVDVTRSVWRELGEPDFLSPVVIVPLPRAEIVYVLKKVLMATMIKVITVATRVIS